MKFGQLFGLSTIESFERDRIVARPKRDELERLAPQISELVNRHLDRSHFVWLVDAIRPRSFLFENVRGIVTARDQNGQPGGVIRQIISDFEELG